MANGRVKHNVVGLAAHIEGPHRVCVRQSSSKTKSRDAPEPSLVGWGVLVLAAAGIPALDPAVRNEPALQGRSLVPLLAEARQQAARQQKSAGGDVAVGGVSATFNVSLSQYVHTRRGKGPIPNGGVSLTGDPRGGGGEATKMRAAI